MDEDNNSCAILPSCDLGNGPRSDTEILNAGRKGDSNVGFGSRPLSSPDFLWE